MRKAELQSPIAINNKPDEIEEISNTVYYREKEKITRHADWESAAKESQKKQCLCVIK